MTCSTFQFSYNGFRSGRRGWVVLLLVLKHLVGNILMFTTSQANRIGLSALKETQPFHTTIAMSSVGDNVNKKALAKFRAFLVWERADGGDPAKLRAYVNAVDKFATGHPELQAELQQLDPQFDRRGAEDVINIEADADADADADN